MTFAGSENKRFRYFSGRCSCSRPPWCATLTFDVQIRGRGLRVADAVADLAQVLAGIVGADGIYDHGAVFLYGHSGFQGRDRLDERPVARPPDGDVARHGFGPARELHLLALQLRLVGRWRHDHGSPRYQDPGCVTDLPLAIPGDARVIPDVLGTDVRYPQLGAVVEYAHGSRRLHVGGIFEPHDFGRRRPDGLAV